MGERRRFRPFDVQFGIAAVSGNEILQNTTSAKRHIRSRVNDPPHRQCRRHPADRWVCQAPPRSIARLMAAKMRAVDQPSISVPQVAASAPKMR